MGDIASKAYEEIGMHTKEQGAVKCKLFKNRFKRKQRQNVCVCVGGRLLSQFLDQLPEKECRSPLVARPTHRGVAAPLKASLIFGDLHNFTAGGIEVLVLA